MAVKFGKQVDRRQAPQANIKHEQTKFKVRSAQNSRAILVPNGGPTSRDHSPPYLPLKSRALYNNLRWSLNRMEQLPRDSNILSPNVGERSHAGPLAPTMLN